MRNNHKENSDIKYQVVMATNEIRILKHHIAHAATCSFKSFLYHVRCATYTFEPFS